MAATVGLPDGTSVSSTGVLGLVQRLAAGPAPGLLARSLLLGLAVFLASMVLSWGLVRIARGPQVPRWRSRVRLLGELVPPLIVGVGVLALSRSAELAGRFAATGLNWPEASWAFGQVARWLDPARFSGISLLLGVCLGILPSRLVAWHEGMKGDRSNLRRIDQALLCRPGLSRARSLAFRGVRRVPLPKLVLWGALAFSGISPAILLTPEMAGRTLGPGIVALASQPGDARAQSAALALCAIVLNLMALGWNAVSGRRDIDADLSSIHPV
jgi:hypothetical protein